LVQTRPRPQTILDRFEELDAIWPRSHGTDRVTTTSLGADEILEVHSRRITDFLTRHRWGLIALVTIAGAASWLAFVAAPAFDARLAEETVATYDGALAAIDLTVPDARGAIAALTDPASDSSDLSRSLERLSPFVVSADAARIAITKELPGTPPLVPRTEIESVGSVRAEVGVVANQADELAARLASLVTYRLLADGLFGLPDLPVAATPDAIDVLSVDMAAAMAASVEIAVSLPADPLLDAHRRLANEAVIQMDGWRTDYLAALRIDDAAAAEATIADIRSMQLALDTALADSLGAIEAWGARELDLLRLAIIEARQLTD
jgi:hypothetical protein